MVKDFDKLEMIVQADEYERGEPPLPSVVRTMSRIHNMCSDGAGERFKERNSCSNSLRDDIIPPAGLPLLISSIRSGDGSERIFREHRRLLHYTAGTRDRIFVRFSICFLVDATKRKHGRSVTFFLSL